MYILVHNFSDCKFFLEHISYVLAGLTVQTPLHLFLKAKIMKRIVFGF